MDMAAALKRCPLFSGLQTGDLQMVASIATRRTYDRREMIFSEGDPAKGFFVLLSGKVKLYKLSPEGREQILRVLSPGEQFAEAAVFSGDRYPAFAEAMSPVAVAYFPSEGFLRLIALRPELAFNMIVALSALLRKFNALVEELSLKEVSARVARYLFDAARRSPQNPGGPVQFDLEVSKAQLASRLGTVSETLSRTFHKMKDRGILDVQGKRITILDLDGLGGLAEGLRL